jgi:hypothetical protein
LLPRNSFVAQSPTAATWPIIKWRENAQQRIRVLADVLLRHGTLTGDEISSV